MKRMQIVVMIGITLSVISFVPNYHSQESDPHSIISGYVYDRDTGEPIPEAMVHAHTGFVRYNSHTDPYGYFRIEMLLAKETEIDVCAEKEGYHAQWDTVMMPIRGSVSMDFELVEKTSRVCGTVYDGYSSYTLNESDVALWTSDGVLVEEMRTEGDGCFEFHCTPGDYYLSCDHLFFNYEESEIFSLGEGEEIVHDFHLEMQTSMIKGYVTNERGIPLPGATIKLFNGRMNLILWADEHGFYDTSVDPGPLNVMVYYAGYQQFESDVHVDYDEELEYDIVMERTTFFSSLEKLKEIFILILSLFDI